jgi:aspartate kinase
LLGIDQRGLPTADSYDRLAAAMDGDGLYIIPGYYGHGPDGQVKVFSRGGSDITGAVVARAVGAQVYENWTDVSGFMMADPRIVKGARPMREVTYAELRELSYMGANVLHEEAIFPVKEAGIPINIRNTHQPDEPGTMIVAERDDQGEPVVGIAGRSNFTVIYIYKHLMNKEIGFGRRVLELLLEHGINFEHMPTGIDSMSLVIDDEELGDRAETLRQDILERLDADECRVMQDLALISTVGIGMSHQVGIAARCFSALANAGVNVRMISQGVGELNIIVGVDRGDFGSAVAALYGAFVA